MTAHATRECGDPPSAAMQAAPRPVRSTGLVLRSSLSRSKRRAQEIYVTPRSWCHEELAEHRFSAADCSAGLMIELSRITCF
jgi:hypothetical protein